MTPIKKGAAAVLNIAVREAFRIGTEQSIANLVDNLALFVERMHAEGVEAATEWRELAEIEAANAIRRAAR